MTWNVIRLGTVGSTNDEAAARAREGAPHGTVIVADAQTRGRGQKGRAWHSPAGENLYVSVVLRPGLRPADAPPLTLAAGVATCDALNHFVAGTSIKWPNDILWSDRKLAGILTETSTRGERIDAVIVGVGVNVNETAFPPDLAGVATSLRLARGEAVDREAVLRSLLVELERWIDVLLTAGPEPVLGAWRGRTSTFGRRIREPAGVAVDIAADGALVVEADGGGERVRVTSATIEVVT